MMEFKYHLMIQFKIGEKKFLSLGRRTALPTAAEVIQEIKSMSGLNIIEDDIKIYIITEEEYELYVARMMSEAGLPEYSNTEVPTKFKSN
jgi:hypothetical protein